MSDYFDPNNDELLQDFYMEAMQQVELLEQNILAIEDNTEDREAVDEIFRAAHTLKGGAATVQMDELAGFTHSVEDLLDEIRADNVKVNSDIVDALLSSIDVIKAMLESRRNGDIYSEDIADLKNTLINLKNGSTSDSDLPANTTPSVITKEAEKTEPTESEKDIKAITEYEILELKEAASGKAVVMVVASFDEENPMNSVGGIQVFAKLKSMGQVLKTTPDFDLLYEDNFFPEVYYYVATTSELSELESNLFISDVTTSIKAHNIDDLPKAKASQVEENQENESVAPENEPLTKIDQSISEDEGEIDQVELELKLAEEKKKLEQEKNKKPVRSKAKEASQNSILRVDSKRIDNLLNLVSEAVINKATFNQISTQFTDLQTQLSVSESEYKEKLRTLFDDLPNMLSDINKDKSIKDIKNQITEKYAEMFTTFDGFETDFKKVINTFKNTAANLARNTSDLHEGILRIRMVPINQIFSRFPRLVRDLQKNLDKKIELVIEGEDTELDKSVIEELLDPLMHCVRNSVDHGIESPADREKIGKPVVGKLLLKASNEGNMIVIEIADDGKGIDVESVRAKAIDRGIIHPGKSLSDIEAFNLIFEPGFSTAKKVSNISGRGVGLDVVKREIDKLNGSVSVWSKPGHGTKFTIKLPLTLAIVQGLLVKVGSEIYAIPITSVIESHRIKPEEINIIDNYEVFNVRNEVISILRLNTLFRLQSETDNKGYMFIVIVGSGDKKMGIVVDSLIGEEDVVIKPLKDKYTNSPGIAGATILGDGTVSLIIDVSQLLVLGVQQENDARERLESQFSR